MNKLEQAARQALEALESVSTAKERGFGIEYAKGYVDPVITALREALAEPQITTPDVCGEVCARAKLCYGCNKDLEEANAKFTEQAEQEPVAWVAEDVCDGQFINGRKRRIWWECIEGAGTPFYAAPVRTKNLTDDEIERALDAANVPELPDGYKNLDIEIARAVIAADREKNR